MSCTLFYCKYNLPLLWSSGDIKIKRKLQYIAFPDDLGYDFKNKRVQTFRVNSIIAKIASYQIS
jgi:site-specific DNA recombinase